MKPPPPNDRSSRGHFPVTDVCFQSSLRDWRGGSWPNDDDDSPAHRFNELNRQFRRESLRERQREMWVFGFVMLIAAWPVFDMIYSVVRLLLHGNPLDL